MVKVEAKKTIIRSYCRANHILFFNILFLRFILFAIMCICACFCECMSCMWEFPGRPEQSDQLKLQLQAGISHLTWVLGIELRIFCRRIIHVLNH